MSLQDYKWRLEFCPWFAWNANFNHTAWRSIYFGAATYIVFVANPWNL